MCVRRQKKGKRERHAGGPIAPSIDTITIILQAFNLQGDNFLSARDLTNQKVNAAAGHDKTRQVPPWTLVDIPSRANPKKRIVWIKQWSTMKDMARSAALQVLPQSLEFLCVQFHTCAHPTAIRARCSTLQEACHPQRHLFPEARPALPIFNPDPSQSFVVQPPSGSSLNYPPTAATLRLDRSLPREISVRSSQSRIV